MLNYILPPVIIVVSIAILIVFLFSKAKQVSEQELYAQRIFEGKPKKKISDIFSFFGHLSLKVLEKNMQKLKLLSLKLHNVSNEWFHSIHERRQRRIILQQKKAEREKNLRKTAEAKKTDYEIKRQEKFQKYSNKIIRPLKTENPSVLQQIEIKEKNKLENVLIRRIAMNPKDIEAYERLGDYYLENENLQDSLECFKQVLKLSPINYKARLKIRRIEKIFK